VDEDEHQREFGDGGWGWGIGEGPGERGEQEKEGQQVGEGGVRAVPGVFRFCRRARLLLGEV
jgi:hypothetical protein